MYEDFVDDINERSIFRTEVSWDAPEQKVRGFGGALTDASLLQYANLSSDLQGELLDGWFGRNGSEFSLVRLPIGGTDFSTHAYTLNDNGPGLVQFWQFLTISAIFQFWLLIFF